jgi:hypothetical protein
VIPRNKSDDLWLQIRATRAVLHWRADLRNLGGTAMLNAWMRLGSQTALSLGGVFRDVGTGARTAPAKSP